MIALEVKDYCQNCAGFDPETTVSERSYCGMTGMNILTDTTVTCRNAQKCNCLYEFIKKENDKEI